MFDISKNDYDTLKFFIKRKLNKTAIHFLDDIIQDLIIERNNLDECFKNHLSIIKRYSSSFSDNNLAEIHEDNVCIKCNKIHPVMMFRTYKARGTTYLGNVCKECIKQQCREYYHNNKDKCKASAKKYRENNPEKRRQIDRDYYKNNPEYFKEKRERNKEYIKNYAKERYKRKKLQDYTNKM